MNLWNKIEKITGSDDNVSKFVFQKDDAVAESVLYKYPTYEERTVMCISTQSGCPVGCRFCGAGDSFVRSLTADEKDICRAPAGALQISIHRRSKSFR